jgi:hypothetical protein
MSRYVILESQQPEQDAQLMQQAVHAVMRLAQTRIAQFDSQHLSNVSWSLARLTGSNINNSNTSSISIDDISIDITNNNHPMSEQYTRLFRAIGMQLADQKRPVTSQHIGTTMWSLSTLGFCDDAVYRNLAIRLVPDQAHGYTPQHMANAVWAIATAEVAITEHDVFDTTLVPDESRRSVTDPIVRCFGVAAQELMRRPHDFIPQHISNIMWSFSKMGIRHPELFRSVALHLVGSSTSTSSGGGSSSSSDCKYRGLDDFSPQEISNLAWAFARQAQLGETTVSRLRRNGTSTLDNDKGRLAVYATACHDMDEALLHRLFAAMAETSLRVHDQLSLLKPQELSNTCWALAVIGLRRAGFLQAANVELVNRLDRFIHGERNSVTTFKGQNIANILWAFATLNVSLERSLDKLYPFICAVCGNGGDEGGDEGALSVRNVASMFNQQELANVAWSCAVFGIYPPDLMSTLYSSLLGSGSERSPHTLASLFGDGGLQLQSIWTMIYVQVELDLEAKYSTDMDLSLPDDFLEAWHQSPSVSLSLSSPAPSSLLSSSSLFADDPLPHPLTNTLTLNLTTSKTQRDVSKAFTRIGFTHVDEHVITMEQLARDYGIRVPAKPMGVLSIDIAHVEDKIAIDVDGPSHYISVIDGEPDDTSNAGHANCMQGKVSNRYGGNGPRQCMNGSFVARPGVASVACAVLGVVLSRDDSAQEEAYCRRLLAILKQPEQ